MGSLLPQRRGEADPAHGQAGEPESDKIFRCLVLIIDMNISVGNSEIPDVEGLTQCGAVIFPTLFHYLPKDLGV